MMRHLVFPALFSISVFLVPTHAFAGRYLALLIGNSEYQHTMRLPNPPSDVALIRDVLLKAGFDLVEVGTNQTRLQMLSALRTFEDQASEADIAMVYYSGHGLELNGQNYLVPVDARLGSDRDVEDEAVSIERLQRAVDGAKRLRLIVLDACRNNPFVQTMGRVKATRAMTRGLGRVEPVTADTLVAFAAKAGTVALDGAGSNSPFATALARRIAEPGLDVRIALGKVRDDVLKETGGQQEPFVYGSLGGAQISLSKTEPVPSDGPTAEYNAFAAARAVGTPGAYDAFIAAFPNSFYTKLAQELRTAALSKPIQPAATPPAPAPPALKPAVTSSLPSTSPASSDDAGRPASGVGPAKPPASQPPSAATKPAEAKPQAARKPSGPKQSGASNAAEGRRPGAGSNCFTFNNERVCN